MNLFSVEKPVFTRTGNERRADGRRESDERRQHKPWVADLNDPRSGFDRRQTSERRTGRDRRSQAR